jgi:O-acetyl-ADP-ribose deacetylase (regulator of RNase III)
MTFEIIQGDLFDPAYQFDAFAQGVNCQGLMGAGIAVPFRERWPEMYEEYKELCAKYRHILPGLLHTHNPDPVEEKVVDGGITLVHLEFPPTVYNLFSQVQPGPNGSYELLQRAAFLMLRDAEEQGFDRVGLPWIGCGIAGLAKHNVEHIFRELLTDSEVEFILVEQPTS